MLDALGSALSGIQRGLRELERAAGAVAESSLRRGPAAVRELEQEGEESLRSTRPASSDDVIHDLVTAMLAKHKVSINAAVARRSVEVSSEVVDILA